MPKRSIFNGRKIYVDNYKRDNFSCETCGISYGNETGLKLHLKMTHKSIKYEPEERISFLCGKCRKSRCNCRN